MTILERITSKIEDGSIKSYDLVKLISNALNISKTKVRILIGEGAVDINEVTNRNYYVVLFKNDVIKIGKGQFLRCDDSFPEGYQFVIK